MLQFNCPYCQHSLRISSESAPADRARCPACDEVFAIPNLEQDEVDDSLTPPSTNQDDSDTSTVCPHCGARMAIVTELVGKRVGCSECHGKFVLPTPPSSPVQNEPRGDSQSVRNQPAAFATTARSARSRFRASARHRFRPATTWFDFFDWKFEKYLTPWIVRATWLACVSLAALWIAVISIGTLVSWAPDIESSPSARRPVTRFEGPEIRTPTLPRWLTSRAASTGYSVTGICFVVIVILWIRVFLETAIVLFNIASTLTSIDDKIDQSEGTT